MGRRLDIVNYNLVAGVEQEINLTGNIDSLVIKARNANNLQIRLSAGNAIYYNLDHVLSLGPGQVREYFPGLILFITCLVNEVIEIIETTG